MKKAVPYIIGIGELQRRASSVIREVATHHEEGVIVSHNQPQAVLVSLKRYARLQALEEAKRLEEDEILALVAKGDEEFETGKTIKSKSLRHLL